MVFSSDGKVIYSITSRRLVAWDAATLQPLQEKEIRLSPRSMGLIQEGKTLFVSDRLDGVDGITTPFVSFPAIYRARCAAAGAAGYRVGAPGAGDGCAVSFAGAIQG